jgi:hypothetical protein
VFTEEGFGGDERCVEGLLVLGALDAGRIEAEVDQPLVAD